MVIAKLENNIPLPRKKNNSGGLRHLKYPWLNTEVGQSFVMQVNPAAVHANVYRANKQYAPREFTCRKLDDGHYRIWRVR